MNIIKNIDYPDFDYYFSKINGNNIEICNAVKNYFYQQFSELSLFWLQKNHGIRLYVEKNVTDMLNKTEMLNISYDDIKFPAKSIEFFFEDKNLPTILFGNRTSLIDSAKSLIKKIDTNKKVYARGLSTIDDNSEIEGINLLFMHPFENNVQLFHTTGASSLKKLLLGELKIIDLSEHFAHGLPKYDHDKEVEKLTISLIAMVIKILLYISIPQYKAIPITDKALKREGKAGVKNRPNRPLSRVIYVPSVVNINKKSSSTETGDAKSPHFRRGHFRMLRDEKFTNKQGQLIFVKPCLIHGGSLQDKLYVARKI